MNEECFNPKFEETLNKTSWTFYKEYLQKLSHDLGIKNHNDYYTFFLGKTIPRKDIDVIYKNFIKQE